MQEKSLSAELIDYFRTTERGAKLLLAEFREHGSIDIEKTQNFFRFHSVTGQQLQKKLEKHEITIKCQNQR